MTTGQGSAPDLTGTRLRSERLGPLPLINAFLERLQVIERLERFVPSRDARVKLPYATSLGVLLRSLLVEREPIYRQVEVVATFAPSVFGLSEREARHFGDNAVGRALDRLFDSDRAGHLTDIVVAAATEFGVKLDELHNDSTTIAFAGQYGDATGRSIRGQRAPFVTHGYSKDHRPDLKQLLFILTTSSDGGVPVQFRCGDGNQSDSTTHQATWEALRHITGNVSFLYVADSKLCNREAMDHIDSAGGRFVTVMPRSRLEDREFRAWIVDHQLEWQLVRDEPHPKLADGPRDRWWVHRSKLPSSEGWPVTWVWSTLLALKQQHRRRERIARASQQLEELASRLAGPKPRLRAKHEIHARIDAIVANNRVTPYLRVELEKIERHTFKQTKRGRPGPKTEYKRETKSGWRLIWAVDDAAIATARASDGMYPLVSNDRELSPESVLDAHKRQPAIEKRFEQVKNVLEIAPVTLQNEGRIEALFFIYFVALLVQAPIERELRLAMRERGISELPLYPEERTTSRPTAEQIFRLYSLTQRNVISHNNVDVHAYEPELTDLQEHVLDLLGVPARHYRPDA
jgi:transposase